MPNLLVFLATVLSASAPCGADVTPEQRRQLSQSRDQIVEAGRLYQQRQYRQSGELVAQVQARLEELAQGGDRELLNTIAVLYPSLEKAHALLELEGVDLPPLKTPGATPVGVATPPRPALPGRPPLPPEPAAGTVSFAGQVAPVLVAKCGGCHVTAARGDFRMENYAALMSGPDGRAVVAPGRPEDSRFMQLIDEGDMPRGDVKLTAAEVTLLRQWIAQGARFDGTDPRQPLAQLAARAAVLTATPEQLSADRVQRAGEIWRLGMPDISPQTLDTDNFHLVGSVSAEQLSEVGRLAEAQLPKIAALLRVSQGQPLFKGRMTLFVFDQRYDYGEFGQMVEKREIPKHWPGHWKNDTVDVYAALLLPRADAYGLDVLLAQQVASAYVAGLGDVPGWLADGVGRAAAARLGGSDPRVQQWQQRLGTALAAMSSPDDFMAGKLPPELAEVAAFSFVLHLMGDARLFQQLLEAVRSGEAVAAAFTRLYRGTPAQVAAAWAVRAARKSGTSRPPGR